MASNHKIKLSVLDQSPVRKGSTAQQAIQETLQLARYADEAGFTRYWLAEHHNTSSLAGSSPEILIAHVAANTKHIRVGSGGVMLPNHSALKVAENFRMLETIFPGRIDLGMGRAPGTDRITASVLNPSNRFSEQDFITQLTDLEDYLHDMADTGIRNGRITAIPLAQTVPTRWLLSSSGQSGIFAAHFGMGFSFAHFISPVGGPEAMQAYRERFSPSADLAAPECNAAFFVFCSESEKTIRQQQAVMDYRFLALERGMGLVPVGYQDIKNETYTLAEQERIRFNRQRMISGTPDQLRPKLEQLATAYGIDELMAVTITERFEDRLLSYQLLAEMFLK